MKTRKSIFLICILHFVFCVYSNAQIVYTDVIPDVTSASIYALDLNNDGINDFEIKCWGVVQSTTCGGNPPATALYIGVNPLNSNEAGNMPAPFGISSSPSALQQHASIDSSSLNWKTDPNQVLARKSWHCNGQGGWPHWVPNYGGPFLGASNKYLALRLHVGAQTFYGWVRLDVNSAVTNFTVKDYAYNSTPNQQIFAGDTCVFPLSLVITGNVSICSGDVVTLSVSGGNSYLWSTGSTTPSVSVNPVLSALFSVTVIDSIAACTAILNQVIYVTSLNATVNQTADTLWTSKHVGGGDSFQWIDCTTQQIIPGDTNYYFLPTYSGSYAVIYSFNGCADTSACFSFSGVGINVNGSSSICIGDSTMLFVSQGSSFLWSTGESTSIIIVSPLTTTNYTVIVYDSILNYTVTLSQQIIVNSISASLNQSNDSLIAIGGDSTSTYKWIDCTTNLLIAGANSNMFIPQTIGNYAAIITSNGCTDTSNCLAVTTGIAENSSYNHLSIYPNPATNSITIKIPSDEVGEIRVMNLLGKTLIELEALSVLKIDVSKFPAGMYVVRWNSGENYQSQKFLITH